MTDRQENKISSYLAVDTFFKRPESTAIWSADTDFSGLVAHFQSIITEILGIQAIQEKDKSGATIRKSDLRTSLESAVLKVVRAAVAHALLINDPDLLAAVDYNIRDLQLARDSALLGIATVVYDAAWPIRTDLTTRHITEDDITLVSTLRDQFLAIIPEPRNNIILTTTATVDLKNKIIEMDNHLRLIDRVIYMFQAGHPDFIDQYTRAREIIDLGHRSTGKQVGRITGTVLEAGTLIPLQNALVEVLKTKRAAKTNEQGQFTFIFRKKAFVTLRISLADHITFTSSLITVNPGNPIKLDIQLQLNN